MTVSSVGGKWVEMSSKKKNKDKSVHLDFIGGNSTDVTGSIIKGEFFDYKLNKTVKFLLEAGGIQDKPTILDNFRSNMEMLEKIDVEELDFVVLNHGHIDHSLHVPTLVQRGFEGRIITTHKTARICEKLWFDSCYINKTEVEWLQSRKGLKNIKPYYAEATVSKTLGYIDTYDYYENIKITPCISMRLVKNKHIIGSSSVEMWFEQENGRKSKLFYTSDLGNDIPKYFVNDEQYIPSSTNILITETTYGHPQREEITKKLRKEELKLIKNTLRETLMGRNSSVIFPAFSLDRTQNILMELKNIIDNDKDLQEFEVICDGRLTNNINDVYSKVLEGEQLDQFKELLEWKNLRRVADYKVTKAIIADKKPRIILSSSGFMTNGHILEYIKHFIKDKNATVVFTGYSPENSLAGKMKRYEQKYIKIDDSNYELKCHVLELHSFSSHIQHNQLLKFLKQPNVTDSIILVHGDMEGRLMFKDILEKELRDCDKTTKVVVARKNMKISF